MEQTNFPNARLPIGPRVPSFSGLLVNKSWLGFSANTYFFSGGFSGRPESITVPSVEPVSIQGIINRVPSQPAPPLEEGCHPIEPHAPLAPLVCLVSPTNLINPHAINSIASSAPSTSSTLIRT